ncbi:hypothetical protein D2E62_21615 [Mycobacteroides abscessus]|nr:hypothetical protein D2E62_21615 [Mycobacteroides abscessus]
MGHAVGHGARQFSNIHKLPNGRYPRLDRHYATVSTTFNMTKELESLLSRHLHDTAGSMPIWFGNSSGDAVVVGGNLSRVRRVLYVALHFEGLRRFRPVRDWPGHPRQMRRAPAQIPRRAKYAMLSRRGERPCRHIQSLSAEQVNEWARYRPGGIGGSTTEAGLECDAVIGWIEHRVDG